MYAVQRNEEKTIRAQSIYKDFLRKEEGGYPRKL